MATGVVGIAMGDDPAMLLLEFERPAGLLCSTGSCASLTEVAVTVAGASLDALTASESGLLAALSFVSAASLSLLPAGVLPAEPFLPDDPGVACKHSFCV